MCRHYYQLYRVVHFKSTSELYPMILPKPVLEVGAGLVPAPPTGGCGASGLVLEVSQTES